MDDALLVSRALGGDLDSLGQLYDRYFHRVYDFSWRVLGDAEQAGAATRETFRKALGDLRSLRRGAAFKPWLLEIACTTAVALAAGPLGRSREATAARDDEAFGGFDVPDASRIDTVGPATVDRETADLVWEAATALSPRDYAFLDLDVRQGLEGSAIAGAVGVSKGQGSAMSRRMREAASDAITSYIVARRGSRDCDALRAALTRFNIPPYDEETRRAVDAHLHECETCQRTRREVPAPLEILAAFAIVPAPFALKGEVWRALVEQWNAVGQTTGPVAIAPSEAMAAMPAGFGVRATGAGDGGGGGRIFGDGGVSDRGDSPRRTFLIFAGAALGLLIVAFGGAALMAMAFGNGNGGNAGAASTTTSEARTPRGSRTPGVIVETPTPNLTPSETPTPEDTGTPAPTSTPPPPPSTGTPTPRPAATSTPDSRPPTRTPRPTRTPTPTKTP